MRREGVPRERFLDRYRKLLRIRKVEEKIDELFRQGKTAGTLHTSIGQEAVAVGAGEALWGKKDPHGQGGRVSDTSTGQSERERRGLRGDAVVIATGSRFPPCPLC